MVQDNLKHIQEKIGDSVRRLGKNPKDITLVGVTKYADVANIRQAIEAGLGHIGENRLQDSEEKYIQIRQAFSQVKRHFLGHLQTNKIKDVLQLFDVIQSVDSHHLAEAIEKHAASLNRWVDVLIQVNTSGEKQKFGVAPSQCLELIDQMNDCPHLHIQGLMTVGPLTEDEAMIRQTFRDLRNLKEQVEKQWPADSRVQMKYLSMGMSHDFKIALEEGSNMVRIGSAIFKNE